jgi:hypothetical protein
MAFSSAAHYTLRMRKIFEIGLTLIATGFMACGNDDGASATDNPDDHNGKGNPITPTTGIKGHFYYTYGDEVFRIEATAGAVAENVSDALGKLSEGSRDRRINASTNGAHITLSTDRFGCEGECLALIPKSLASGELVKPDGQDAYTEGLAAVSNNGELIVYPAQGGPHRVDLFATRKQGSVWSAPVLLTSASSYAYNNMPSLSLDGSRIVFDCGAEPYPEAGSNDACEVKTDGTGFRKIVGPNTLANPRNSYVQNPHEGVDGLLFESSWPIGDDHPETIWLLPATGGNPQPIGMAFPNAVSPCALSDGRFGMLWLGRSGNATGAHELVVATRDGSSAITLTPNLDVADIGIGCSD